MQRLPKFAEEKHLAETLKTPQALETYEKLLAGSQIKELRRKLKLTQKEIAAKLKTSQSVIARIEAGKQNCSIGLLVRLGFVFGKRLHIQFR